MFTHLHVHSHFSFGLGVSSPEALAEAAAERGFSALACTDTNGVYGAVEFQRACDAAGVRPILGAHLVADGQEAVALAMNEQGWGALCRAITRFIGRDTDGCHPERSARGGEPSSRALLGQSVPQSEHPAPNLATDRDGLILLSRDIGFLEQTLRPQRPRESLRRASARPEPPRGAGRRPPAGPSRRRHQWRGRRAGGGVEPPPAAARHRAEYHAFLPARGGGLAHSGLALLRPSELARHFPDCPEAIRAAEDIAERCSYTDPGRPANRCHPASPIPAPPSPSCGS